MSVPRLSIEDDGKSIKLRQDDVIIVSLEETPTTGYRWTVDNLDEKILELQNEGFRIAPGAGIGGSGTRAFSFRAIAVGSANLKLKLWREWAGDASITKRYNLTIKVVQ